jgi:predicted MFS family arabinose efflux permease
MMNNYIIAPSSAYYAEALGCNDALSGIMVGAAPLFAMSSSVVYSYWTNYNYKHPMLFAATLQIIGNLLYASAFSYKSIRMCLIGRAITGLGAPRVINRR